MNLTSTCRQLISGRSGLMFLHSSHLSDRHLQFQFSLLQLNLHISSTRTHFFFGVFEFTAQFHQLPLIRSGALNRSLHRLHAIKFPTSFKSPPRLVEVNNDPHTRVILLQLPVFLVANPISFLRLLRSLPEKNTVPHFTTCMISFISTFLPLRQ